MPHRTPAAALAAVLLAVAGCGTGTSGKDSAKQFSGEQKAVATTVEDLQKAGSDRKESEICDHLLAKALVDRITAASKKSCSDAVKKTLQDADSFDLTVLAGGVTIKGATATARVRAKMGDTSRLSTLRLVKEGARWKVSALG